MVSWGKDKKFERMVDRGRKARRSTLKRESLEGEVGRGEKGKRGGKGLGHPTTEEAKMERRETTGGPQERTTLRNEKRSRRKVQNHTATMTIEPKGTKSKTGGIKLWGGGIP